MTVIVNSFVNTILVLRRVMMIVLSQWVLTLNLIHVYLFI